MNLFSQQLRQLRLEHGMVQRELADIAGIKTRAYQLYEQGKTEPSIDVLIKFADVFGVGLDELVGRNFSPSVGGVSAAVSQTNLPVRPSA